MSNESVRLITKAQLDEYKKLEEENAELIEKIEQLELRNEELEQQNAFECECNKEYVSTLEKNENLEKRLFEAEKVTKENAELKNLLKRCRPLIKRYDCGISAQLNEKLEVLTEIDEVLNGN